MRKDTERAYLTNYTTASMQLITDTPSKYEYRLCSIWANRYFQKYSPLSSEINDRDGRIPENERKNCRRAGFAKWVAKYNEFQPN